MVRTPAQALAKAKTYTEYKTGMCLQWVRIQYNIGAVHPTAQKAYNATKYRHTSTPPPGVPVWWTGGSRGYGHVAISAGDGYVYSTDVPSSGRVGRISISSLTRAWGHKYRGWSEDINSVRVYTPPKTINRPRPGAALPSAIPLQRALKKGGFMPKSVKEHRTYGPQTRAAVRRFHNKHKQFSPNARAGKPGGTVIGPKGFKYIMDKWG